MTRKLYLLDGNWHVSGRSHPHTVFQGTPDDPRPHALVTEAFGEHLMTVEPGRYQWVSTPDAIPALTQNEGLKPKRTKR